MYNYYKMEFLFKMADFEVEIQNIKYDIKFEKEETKFKPLNLTIIRNYKSWQVSNGTKNQQIRYNCDILEQKYYNRIRRRIYYNITNIDKLKDGKIRQYQIFNQVELEVLAKYLTDKKILFRIYAETVYYKTLYCSSDKLSYNSYFRDPDNKEHLPDKNRVNPLNKIYIRVYKGFHEINELKKTFGTIIPLKYKYTIYLK